MEKYDLIVIGGGSGGLTATTIAARLGARVLLVDKTSLGGDCLHDGCVPSKALIASARLAHQMRRAREFGLGDVEVKVDIAQVMQRIRDIQGVIGEHDSAEAMRALGAEVMFGGARFVDAHTVEIGGQVQVAGERIIIATGSQAMAPPIPGLAEAGYLNHVSIFKIERLPRRIAVLGGGPIGVEIGQSLQRLGAQVTIIQGPARLLEREEPEVAAHLAKALRDEGVDVRLAQRATRIEKRGDEKVVHARSDLKKWQEEMERGGAHVDPSLLPPDPAPLVVDEVFVAVGRRPTLDALNLEAAGVETSPRGVVVDDELRTSVSHIFAVGDCAGGPQFTHWAEYEARIATRNALFVGSESRAMEVVPWVTFTDPEVARVGLTEAEARREHGDEAHVHRFHFDHLDRALTEREPGGFCKVVVDKKERVLGAHIIGHNAGEALSEWVLAMEHPGEIKLGDIAKAIHAYPTMVRINRRVGDMEFIDHGVPGWQIKLAARFKPRAPRTASGG
jgi:pyruvate/2-oxoglutarate dehydrogenase complex dihydrolipoamide dehydrogenase (E3) component